MLFRSAMYENDQKSHKFLGVLFTHRLFQYVDHLLSGSVFLFVR